jgi:hypothetical protein
MKLIPFQRLNEAFHSVHFYIEDYIDGCAVYSRPFDDFRPAVLLIGDYVTEESFQKAMRFIEEERESERPRKAIDLP